jgi:hypothetical protein
MLRKCKIADTLPHLTTIGYAAFCIDAAHAEDLDVQLR